VHLREGKVPWLIRVLCTDNKRGRDTAGASGPEGSDNKRPLPSSAMVDNLTDPYESDSDSESFFEREEKMLYCPYSRSEEELIHDFKTSPDFIMAAAVPENTGRIANPSVAGGGVKTRPTRP